MSPSNTITGTTYHLDGKVAVVTGASSGIGAATATALAASGASVVVAARREDRLVDLVQKIRDSGGSAVAQRVDTTSLQDCTAMVERAAREFGRLDFAVNSAGVPGRGAFLDVEPEIFDRAIDVNLRGTIFAMRAEIPAILDAGGGAVVNVASVGGLVGVAGLSAYSASKHGVIGLTKSVALEFAQQGVRVNAVAPGGTDTEMLSSGTQEQKDYLAGLSAMKRISAPEEVATAILFLLADATSSTGIVLPTDGGQSVG